ncbi:FtsX-like permease family protein [Blastococcus saxobsidens]|uniref:Putative ABC transport system permease protein n=1 Tax=Blastococcus saxobsidens TaxID=138336 RepID=A0A4V2G2M0_9ACTN|nr:FtsX-like permease family protein [Blastococcus saxobsidens]RZU33666.1 putative ABC transport system permease protein [Blastococcus saxobsidens]
MSGWLTRWRLALRMARRDARRHRGRTALVLLMVGLPVLAVVGADTLLRTWQISPAEALPATLGAADARIEGVARSPIEADPLTGEPLVFEPDEEAAPWSAAEVRGLLPDGAEVVERTVGRVAYRAGAGYADVPAYADDLDRPIRDGAVEVVEGRVPSTTDEVAVSGAVAERAGVAVGQPLRVTPEDVPLTVVGIVAPGAGARDDFVVVAPGSADLLRSRSTEFYASVPGGLDWPAVRELNAAGLAVVSRAVVADPPAEPEYRSDGGTSGPNTAEVAVLALIVAGILLEVVLLAGPAFAVGLRRQRRDLALLAAVGGSPADLQRTVLASGVVLGGGAAVGGALLGIGLAWLALPLVAERADVRFGPFDVAPLDVLAVVATGLLAGLAASAVPATQAARTDVVPALAGRRGQVRTSWRLPVVGLVGIAAGAVLTVLGAQGGEFGVAAGAVLLVAGTVVATPWLVGLLAPLARWLPAAGLIAVRDATRNRTRTASAVAAVLATVAAVTTMAIGSQSDSTQARRDYVPQAPMGAAVVTVFQAGEEAWTAVEGIVAEQLPGHPIGRIWSVAYLEAEPRSLSPVRAGCTGGPGECHWFPEDVAWLRPTFGGEVVVADAGTVAAAVPAPWREEVAAALRAERAVVFGSGAVDAAGEVTLLGSTWNGSSDEVLGRAALPATEISISSGAELQVPSLVVVPPALADRLPVPVTTTALVIGGPDAPVGPAAEERLAEAVRAVSAQASVYVERGWTDGLAVARLLLFVVGGVLVLVATLTATGLALADSRPDLATLAAIGAAPRTRRFIAMGSAAVIGVGGALLGLLVGAGPGIAVAHPLTSNDYGAGARAVIDVPWLLLGGVAVAVPLLAVAVTGLVVRSRLPMVRRVDA